MHSCGNCTACCKIMIVEALDKPSNTWCPHCKIAEGCGIYESRPDACRIYECVWLQSQRGGKPMAFELRPDKSRVVIGVTNQGDDIVLYVSPDRPDAWKIGEMGRFVAEMRAKGFPVAVACGKRLRQL